MKFGERVLIIRGPHTGRQADVVYEYWRNADGFCQMPEEIGFPPKGFESVYMAVPVFDHCGTPRIVELGEDDFKRLKR